MAKNKNNKGYMLVEIILASAIAFGVAFFILSLIMKLKTKNDDLFSDTVVNTDRTIITNKLMSQAILEGRLSNNGTNEPAFDCNELKIIDGKTIKYRDEIINTIDDMAIIDEKAIYYINHYKEIMDKELTNNEETNKSINNEKTRAKSYCSNEMGVIHVNIPISVQQMPDKNYDINIDYKYQIGDLESPKCEFNIANNNIELIKSDNFGIKRYGIVLNNSELEYNNIDKMELQEGTYYGFVEDYAGWTCTCSKYIVSTSEQKNCIWGSYSWGGYCCKDECPSGYDDNGNNCIKKVSETKDCVAFTSRTSCENHSYCVWGAYGDCKGSYCPYGSKINGGCYSTANKKSNCNYPYETSYTCPSGYVKINNNYCYKAE